MIDGMESKVSIIIPIYNLESYLKYCLDSLANQSYKNIEIVMVDDGSTDNSVKICSSYVENDDRFILLQKENGGVSSARNAGLDNITGDYFTFVDGDDWVGTTYVYDLLAIMLKDGVDIACSHVKVVYGDNGEPVAGNSLHREILGSSIAIQKLLYLRGVENYVMGKIYNSSMLSGVRFNTALSIGEDMEYLFRIFKKTKDVALMSAGSYFYRQRYDSAMNSSFSLKRADACLAVKSILNNLSISSDEKLAAQTKLFSESVTLLAMMELEGDRCDDLYKTTLSDALSLSRIVLLNREARLVTRMYALLINFNRKLTFGLAGLMRKRIRRAIG